MLFRRYDIRHRCLGKRVVEDTSSRHPLGPQPREMASPGSYSSIARVLVFGLVCARRGVERTYATNVPTSTTTIRLDQTTNIEPAFFLSRISTWTTSPGYSALRWIWYLGADMSAVQFKLAKTGEKMDEGT